MIFIVYFIYIVFSNSSSMNNILRDITYHRKEMKPPQPGHIRVSYDRYKECSKVVLPRHTLLSSFECKAWELHFERSGPSRGLAWINWLGSFQNLLPFQVFRCDKPIPCFVQFFEGLINNIFARFGHWWLRK